MRCTALYLLYSFHHLSLRSSSSFAHRPIASILSISDCGTTKFARNQQTVMTITTNSNPNNTPITLIPSPHFDILLLILVPFHVQNRLHKYVEAFSAQMHVFLTIVDAQDVIISLFATAVCVHGLATSIALYRIAHSAPPFIALTSSAICGKWRPVFLRFLVLSLSNLYSLGYQ